MNYFYCIFIAIITILLNSFDSWIVFCILLLFFFLKLRVIYLFIQANMKSIPYLEDLSALRLGMYMEIRRSLTRVHQQDLLIFQNRNLTVTILCLNLEINSEKSTFFLTDPIY